MYGLFLFVSVLPYLVFTHWTQSSVRRWSNFLRQVVNCLWSHPSRDDAPKILHLPLMGFACLGPKSTSLLYYLVENYWTNEQILSYYCKLQSGGAPIYILKGKVFIIQSLICAIFILPLTRFWNLFSASFVILNLKPLN